MRLVIASTTEFHLAHLARELISHGRDVKFISYLPRSRTHQYGIPDSATISLFRDLLPLSLLARAWRLGPTVQDRFVQRALAATDVLVSEVLPACDIFVGLSGMGVKSAKVARQKHNSKVIIDRGAQHVLEQMRLNSGKPSGFLNDWYVQRELSSYEQADVISVPTKVVERSFSKNGFNQKKVFVNPYGVDTNLFYPDLPGKKVFNRVLFVGSWSYQKGCDYLPGIIESNPKTEFVHCGVVKDLELPKSKNFRSMGKTSRSDLATLMRSSDLLMLPSRQDGFGLVLLEALSSGLLVVASDQTGAPEIKSYLPNESSIQIFRSEDPEDLRNAFERAREIRSDMNRSDIHQITKANFSWAAYAKRFQEQFYDA